MKSTAWGQLQYGDSNLIELSRSDLSTRSLPNYRFLPFGLGRSYGDVGINPGGIGLSMGQLNRFVSFDNQTGVLECEAGISIRDIQNTFASRGWIAPASPGTSFVTIGGAIANDVHGKNHHSQGSFGNHVLELTLMRSDGTLFVCSRTQNENYFRATIGGLGLTGIIIQAKIQLARVPSPWVQSETLTFANLDGFFELSNESEAGYEASVAWFDCSTKKAGRGSFTRGNHVASDRTFSKFEGAKLSIPVTPPVSLINSLTLDPLNSSYFLLKKLTSGQRLESLWSFYYPLDGIGHWNRAYGRRGFFQYQSAIPSTNAAEATKEMLKVISKSGIGSFLAVLKTFGKIKSEGMLSFPLEGVTLALDFPNLGGQTETLFKALDEIVVASRGRLNPSKDARMSRDMFANGYPNHEAFLKYRDPGITSGFAQRIFGS